jgi:hypothetical protein
VLSRKSHLSLSFKKYFDTDTWFFNINAEIKGHTFSTQQEHLKLCGYFKQIVGGKWCILPTEHAFLIHQAIRC